MVDVNVRTKSGRVITGLDLADFELDDNGVRQQIATVSYGKVPIDVTVALDISQSVTGSLLNQLRSALMQIVRDLSDRDRFKLLVFNAQVARTVEFTNDVGAVERALRAVAAGGGTALFDTLGVALVSPAPADRRQLIVAFSDGTDSVSTLSPATLHKIIERTRATVSFVLLPQFLRTEGAAPRLVKSDPALSRIASETGGQLLTASASNLGVVFMRALDAFRSTYVLHYIPDGVERSGFHTIDVRVNRAGAVVQARRGYFAK
jgi:VWFA-related protein